MDVLLFVWGSIVWYLVTRFFSGEKEWKEGRIKSIKINIWKYTYHLHHWLIWLIFLIFLYSMEIYNLFLSGFIVGLIIQWLTYKDFYKIIYHKK